MEEFDYFNEEVRNCKSRTCSPPISLPAITHCAKHRVTCDTDYALRWTDSQQRLSSRSTQI